MQPLTVICRLADQEGAGDMEILLEAIDYIHLLRLRLRGARLLPGMRGGSLLREGGRRLGGRGGCGS